MVLSLNMTSKELIAYPFVAFFSLAMMVIIGIAVILTDTNSNTSKQTFGTKQTTNLSSEYKSTAWRDARKDRYARGMRITPSGRSIVADAPIAPQLAVLMNAHGRLHNYGVFNIHQDVRMARNELALLVQRKQEQIVNPLRQVSDASSGYANSADQEVRKVLYGKFTQKTGLQGSRHVLAGMFPRAPEITGTLNNISPFTPAIAHNNKDYRVIYSLMFLLMVAAIVTSLVVSRHLIREV